MFLSVFVLRGLLSAHPPWDTPSGRGELCQGSVLLCHLFLPLVSIFGLFPVLVSCHYEFICVQLCVCDCVNYPVYISPVF